MGIFNLHKEKYDITFISKEGSGHFAKPILVELEKKYTVQYLYPKHKYQYNHWQVKGDIIWVEWAHKFAREVSKKKWKHKKVIVRLHRYEIDTMYMDSIKWENIDLLIFVNPELEAQFKSKFDINIESITIPNAIDISQFSYTMPTKENTLLSYSLNFDYRKGYKKLIELFYKIVQINPDFRLTIAAQYSINREMEYYINECKEYIVKNRLQEVVNLHIINDDNEILDLLNDHNAIISYSESESFHYSFAEGLLSGLEGFCKNWQEFDLECFWKDWCFDNEQDFIRAILKWRNASIEDRITRSKKNREYIINNYSSSVISNVYEEILFFK